MIYFNDEFKTPKPPPTRLRRWIKRLLWAVFAVIVIVWISLRALMSVGGHDAKLQKAVEAYLGQATGLTVRIGAFRNAQFYPISLLDIGDVSFSPPGDKNPAVIATLGALRAETDFWDRAVGRSALQTFDVQDLDVPARWLAQPLHVDRFSVQKTGPDGAAALLFKGRYGEMPVTGSLAMRWTRRGDGRLYYKRASVSPFTLHAASFDASGTLRDHPGGGVEIDLDHLTAGGQRMDGTLVFLTDTDGDHLNGTLHMAGAAPSFTVNWTAKADSLSGTISVPSYDLQHNGDLVAWKTMLVSLIAPDHRAALARLLTFKGTIKLAQLHNGTQALGAVNATLTLAGGILKIGPADKATMPSVCKGASLQNKAATATIDLASDATAFNLLTDTGWRLSFTGTGPAAHVTADCPK